MVISEILYPNPPAGHRGEACPARALVHTVGHVLEAVGVLVDEGVQVSERLSAGRESDCVDLGEDCGRDRAGRGGAADAGRGAAGNDAVRVLDAWSNIT